MTEDGSTEESTIGQTARPTVSQDAPNDRYLIEVNGVPAGKAEYRIDGDTVAFVHTEIDPAFAGQGLASVLIKSALDDVRTKHHKVAPYCPFVRRYISRHDAYLDLVDPAIRGQFDL